VTADGATGFTAGDAVRSSTVDPGMEVVLGGVT
jgi:hypothetical protein